jgi:O-antigen/teichoic acid export membrane protein
MVGSSIATALLLIRIATQHLSPEELGLWTFCFASVGYFLLLDFGVSNSLGRLFADPISKGDHRATSGWLLLTLCVLTVQGVVIAIVALLLRDPLIVWFDIPQHLVPEAKSLWTWLVLLQAITLPGRALPGVIHAQNRVYNIHLFSIVSAWINVILFWLWIRQGAGVMSYAYASAVSVGITQLGYIFMVFSGRDRLLFYWVAIPWQHLRELFGYAGAIFVLGLATQAMAASQGLIVTKLLGLEALAVLSLTGRLPAMINALAQRPFNASCPRWTLQYTGMLREKFAHEFSSLFQLTTLAGFALAIFVFLMNGPFLCWWTKPAFYGGQLLTSLMCLAIVAALIQQCLGFAFHLTKKMSVYTVVLLVGSGLELGLSIILVKFLGLVGIPAATLLVAISLTLWFHLLVGGRMINVSAFAILLKETPIIVASAALVWLSIHYVSPLLPESGLSALLWSCFLGAVCCTPILGRMAFLLERLWSRRSKAV